MHHATLLTLVVIVTCGLWLVTVQAEARDGHREHRLQSRQHRQRENQRREKNSRGDRRQNREIDEQERRGRNQDSDRVQRRQRNRTTSTSGMFTTPEARSLNHLPNLTEPQIQVHPLQGHPGGIVILGRRPVGRVVRPRQRQRQRPGDNDSDGNDPQQNRVDDEVEEDDGEESVKEYYRGRMRNKMARVMKIQKQVLEGLGLTRKPDLSNLPPHTREQVDRLTSQWAMGEKDSSLNTEHYSRKYQSIMTLCEPPRNSDESFFNGDRVRLYFPIKSPSNVSDDKEIRVSTATLRLYKKPIDTPLCENCTSSPMNQSETTTDPLPRPRPNNHRHRHQRHVVNGEWDHDYDDDEEEEYQITTNPTPASTEIPPNSIRLVIYKYKRPVKAKKREPKKKKVPTATLR